MNRHRKPAGGCTASQRAFTVIEILVASILMVLVLGLVMLAFSSAGSSRSKLERREASFAVIRTFLAKLTRDMTTARKVEVAGSSLDIERVSELDGRQFRTRRVVYQATAEGVERTEGSSFRFFRVKFDEDTSFSLSVRRSGALLDIEILVGWENDQVVERFSRCFKLREEQPGHWNPVSL